MKTISTTITIENIGINFWVRAFYLYDHDLGGIEYLSREYPTGAEAIAAWNKANGEDDE